MTGQQKKFAEVFGIFESLLTQNPTNEDSELSLFFQTIWKTISKSKNRKLCQKMISKFASQICFTFDAIYSFADLPS